MATTLPYYEQKDIENIKKLREMTKTLPPFCTEFFRGIEPRTSTRTRIAYAYDLSVFFDFLKKENPVFSKMERMDFTLDHLDQITVTDIALMSTIRKLLIKNGELCARSLPLKAFITTFSVQKN